MCISMDRGIKKKESMTTQLYCGHCFQNLICFFKGLFYLPEGLFLIIQSTEAAPLHIQIGVGQSRVFRMG